MKIPVGGEIQVDDEVSGSSLGGLQLRGNSRPKRRYSLWMHKQLPYLVDPYAIARRIRQLRNSQEAADNNQMSLKNDLESSDESSSVGRMKRLKVFF